MECIHKQTENTNKIEITRGNVVPIMQINIIKDKTVVDKAEIKVEAGL